MSPCKISSCDKCALSLLPQDVKIITVTFLVFDIKKVTVICHFCQKYHYVSHRKSGEDLGFSLYLKQNQTLLWSKNS